MSSERENNENTGAASGQPGRQQAGTSGTSAANQSILEQRLAEIQARSEKGLSSTPAGADQPSAPAGQQALSSAPSPETENDADSDTEENLENLRPDQLGDGLSILGAVPLAEESLRTPTTSPEVIQPDELSSPTDKAFPVPDAQVEEPVEEPVDPPVAAASAEADNPLKEVAYPETSAQVQPAPEANPTEAPAVEDGETQADVLTDEGSVRNAAPSLFSGSSESGATQGGSDEGAADEEHDLEEPADAELDHLSLADLQARLFQQVREPGAGKNPRHVFELHRRFDQMYNAEKAAALERFVQEGGTAEDFEYSGAKSQQEVEQAMQQFRENRHRNQRQEEEQKNLNLQRKRQLLHDLRDLVEATETGHSGEKLKAIQAEWKNTGPVPQSETQELWNSYHALLDIYYNNRSIYNELKELDRKRNYDLKVQLCERAEALITEPSINKSLQELRHLHEEWKNIGPVQNEMRDSIWERFIQASEQVHIRKKEFLTKRNQEEEENLRLKQELITRIESLPHFTSDRINDWREKTDEIQKLKEEWDKTGLVPKAEADSVNKRFWGAYKAFFQHKNQFFKSLDEQKMQNLRLKIELCEEAEALKDHPDWNETRENFIQLQKKWKTIGRVPEKQSDKIWDRFRTACNAFFDRKNQEARQREAAQERQSAEKEAFLQEVSARIEQTPEGEGNLDELNLFLQRWDELDTSGQRGSHKHEDRFYGALEKYLQKVPHSSREQLEELKFQLQVGRLKSHPEGNQRIHQKEQSIRREISDLENDIRTLQTNIEFFGRSRSAEKLKEEYGAKIADATRRIDYLKRQLRVLRG